MSTELSFSKLVKLGVLFTVGGLWLSTGPACSSDGGDDDGGAGGQGGSTAPAGGSTSTGGTTAATTTDSGCGIYPTASHYFNAKCGTNCAACHTAEPTCSCTNVAACAIAVNDVACN